MDATRSPPQAIQLNQDWTNKHSSGELWKYHFEISVG